MTPVEVIEIGEWPSRNKKLHPTHVRAGTHESKTLPSGVREIVTNERGKSLIEFDDIVRFDHGKAELVVYRASGQRQGDDAIHRTGSTGHIRLNNADFACVKYTDPSISKTTEAIFISQEVPPGERERQRQLGLNKGDADEEDL